MTEVEFFTGGGELLGFRVHGHSGYADQGSDIVCAAVSSAVIMTMNTVTDVLHTDAEVSAGDGDAVLKISKKDAERCSVLLQGLKLHLLELEKQYSDFITIKFTEV